MTVATELLVLHGVRLLGFATAGAVARRFSLDPGEVAELLEDVRARGWVSWSEFGGSGGWSLTDAGRHQGERLLADELDDAGRREDVRAAYDGFLGLNARVLRAITRWQTRPTPWDPLAANDHADWPWDERVLRELAAVGERLQPLCDDLVDALDRFAGYGERYARALELVDRGRRDWVDSTSVDSCHTVWFQLHEDLLATLGVRRGEEPAAP